MKLPRYIIYDHWLSNIISKDAYTIILECSELSKKRSKEISKIISSFNRPCFLQSKISTSAMESVAFLERINFSLTDTNVILKKETKSLKKHETIYPKPKDIEVRLADPKDEKELIKIARSIFVYSRFHLDPLFSNDLADKIKGEWVRSYFKGGRGNQMIICTVNRELAGFLQIIKSNKNDFIIDLIGVDPSHQKKGLAKLMVHYAIKINQESNEIIVGTQIANTPSLKFYHSLGFVVNDSKYVFHCHLN